MLRPEDLIQQRTTAEATRRWELLAVIEGLLVEANGKQQRHITFCPREYSNSGAVADVKRTLQQNGYTVRITTKKIAAEPTPCPALRISW